MLKRAFGLALVILFLSTVVFLGASGNYASGEELKARSGTILSAAGNVNIKKADGSWVAAAKGMKLNQNDRIRTGSMSSADIALKGDSGDSIVHVDKNSEVVIDQLVADKASGNEKTTLDVAVGSVLIKAAKLKGESKFEVSTPTSIVGVRGTGFEVSVSAVKE